MNREKEIFDAVLELQSPEERAAFVNGACGSDSELKAAVEELLSAHFDAGDFLPTRPGDVLPLSEGEGTVIGRYKLLQKIGEGGFGVVYMADQKEPVRRRVALKIIKLGMDSKQVVARFEAERQALAMMDHPNIARVLDGGTTDDGRPFFVMDLVKGLPITDYCDSHKLSARRRLELVIDVCNAVQHAHQKGVIHRDLKPSNVLVTPHDGRPVPMIIDFGIAKALQQPLTNHTLFTGFNQMIGTPAYMSPEQAEMNALDVDTRADIYSLGVILYELLTGAPPIDPKRLREAGFGEMQRLIREEEAEKPSTRIRTLEDAQRTLVAEQRQADPVRLGRTLSGELDWVVLKALEKDRSRRYDTAGALGDDIKRYIEGDAVEACPPTTFYVVQKFVRKHRMPFAVIGLVVFALGIGAVMSTWQAVRASAAEHSATDLLWNSYLVQARAIRSTAHPGRHFESLEAIRKASSIRPSLELRNEAAASLVLADLRPSCLVDSSATNGPERGFVFDTKYRRYAVPQTDGSIEIRDIEGNANEFRIPAHPKHPGGYQWAWFSPNGQFLAVRSTHPSYHITVWKLDPMEAQFEISGNLTDFFGFSPDSKLIATQGASENTVHIYDLVDQTLKRELKCSFKRLRGSTFSPNSRKLAVYSKSRILTIFDVESGAELRTFDDPRGFMGAGWHPNGNYLATGDFDFGIKIWDLETGITVDEFRGHEAEVTKLVFHPSGRFLFSSGWDRITSIWDFHRGYRVLQTPGTFETLGTTGNEIAFGLNRAGAGIWEFTGGTPSLKQFRIKGKPGHKVADLSISNDGRWLATTREGLSLWNLENGALIAEASGVSKPRDVSFARTGTSVFVGGNSGVQRMGLRSIIDENGESRTAFYEESTLTEGKINHLGLSHSGKTVAVIRGESVHILDSDSGDERAKLVGQRGIDHGDVVFSPDDRWLVGTCWAGEGIRIWDMENKKAEPVDLLKNQSVVSAKFSLDGHWLLTGTRATYQFWKVGDWSEDKSKRFNRSVVGGRGAMAFHPTKPILALSVDETLVQLIDTNTRATLVELRPPNPTSIKKLTFSPDGSRIAALSSLHDVFVWNLPMLRKELAKMGLDWD